MFSSHMGIPPSPVEWEINMWLCRKSDGKFNREELEHGISSQDDLGLSPGSVSCSLCDSEGAS